jgi:hypothetical protein
VGATARRATANEFTWALKAGATRTDNVRRVSDNEESETSGDAALSTDLLVQRKRFDARLSTNVEYRRYFDSDVGNDLVGGLNGEGTYAFIPEVFSWRVQDNFGQTYLDPRQVETPDNRQNTNFFTTGPDLTLPIGDRTAFSALARYSLSSFETTDSDDERRMFGAGLIRKLSERASLSLYGTTEKVEFKDVLPGLPSDHYTRNSAFVGFNATGRRTTLAVQAGGTQVRDFGDTIDGPFANLVFERDVGARSTFTLDVGTALTDSAEAFRRDQTLTGVVLGNEDTPVTADPFQSDYATITWSMTGVRTALSFGGDYRRDDHERDDTFNRKSFGAFTTVTQRLSGVLAALVSANWRRDDYQADDQQFSDWSVGAGLDWYLTRSVAINLRGDHFKGSGDLPAGSGQRDYTENRASVYISYSPRR